MYAITEYVRGRMRVARLNNVKAAALSDFGRLITSRNLANRPGILHCVVLHTNRVHGDLVCAEECTVIVTQTIDGH